MWQRVRAMVTTGVIWAVGFSGVALVISSALRLQFFLSLPGENRWLFARTVIEGVVKVGAVGGFVSGFLFAALLSSAVRRRRFSALPTSLVAALGATAGLAFPVIRYLQRGLPTADVLPSLVTTAVFGAVGAGFAVAYALAWREAGVSPRLPLAEVIDDSVAPRVSTREKVPR